jgi:RING finger protein 113A
MADPLPNSIGLEKEHGDGAQTSVKGDSDSEPVVVFRKIAPSKRNVKKRPHDSVLAEEDDTVAVTKKSKQGTVGLVDEAANAESGVSALEGTSYGFAYESSGAKRVGSADQGVTVSNKELEEAAGIRKTSAIPTPQTSVDGKTLYTGAAGYTQHIKQSKYSGPVRQTSHIRPDVRMDYARDICKDYKETGYCGYGDTCIFLHDRSDYKAGWQIEREWELEEKQKRENKAQLFASRPGQKSQSSTNQEDITEEGLTMSSKNSKDLPFACYICRKPFVDPIVTKCGHYFCQKCALDRHATNKTCAVCAEPTGGSFNSALKILKRRDELAKLASKSFPS